MRKALVYAGITLFMLACLVMSVVSLPRHDGELPPGEWAGYLVSAVFLVALIGFCAWRAWDVHRDHLEEKRVVDAPFEEPPPGEA